MITPEEMDRTAARLQDALLAAANIMPVDPANVPNRSRIRHLPGWLVPLAAAACVVLVVGASLFVARHFASTGPPTAPSDIPSYYVTASDTYQSRQVLVRQTSDGKVTDQTQVPAPAGWQITGLSVAADNTTFFVTAAKADSSCPANRLYRFSITGSGRITGFDRVGSTVNGQLSALAASPDGERVASVTYACGAQFPLVSVQVTNLTTGSVGTWTNTVTAATPARVSSVVDLSWLPDGRTLALSYWWQPYAAGQQDEAVLELDTASAGGSLQEYSHVVWTQHQGCTMCVYGALIGPDGRTLIATAARPVGSDPALHSSIWDVRVERISLATGRVEAILYAATATTAVDGPPTPRIWADGSGRQLLVGATQFGWLRDGRLVPLPLPPNLTLIAWLAGDQ
jgi:hypothetical protein